MRGNLQSYTTSPYWMASSTECIPVSLQVYSTVERRMSQVGFQVGRHVVQCTGGGAGGAGATQPPLGVGFPPHTLGCLHLTT